MIPHTVNGRSALPPSALGFTIALDGSPQDGVDATGPEVNERRSAKAAEPAMLRPEYLAPVLALCVIDAIPYERYRASRDEVYWARLRLRTAAARHHPTGMLPNDDAVLSEIAQYRDDNRGRREWKRDRAEILGSEWKVVGEWLCNCRMEPVVAALAAHQAAEDRDEDQDEPPSERDMAKRERDKERQRRRRAALSAGLGVTGADLGRDVRATSTPDQAAASADGPDGGDKNARDMAGTSAPASADTATTTTTTENDFESSGRGGADTPVTLVDRIVSALDEARRRHYGADMGRDKPDRHDVADARKLLVEGVSLEFVQGVVDAKVGKFRSEGRPPPYSLRVFVRDIRDAWRTRDAIPADTGNGMADVTAASTRSSVNPSALAPGVPGAAAARLFRIMGRQAFQAWIAPLQVTVAGDAARIVAPNSFLCDHVAQHHDQALRLALGVQSIEFEVATAGVGGKGG